MSLRSTLALGGRPAHDHRLKGVHYTLDHTPGQVAGSRCRNSSELLRGAPVIRVQRERNGSAMSEIDQLFQLDLQSGHISAPRWSPGGRFLAIPTQFGSTAIFDIDAEQVTHTLESESGPVISVGWDPRADVIMTSSVDRSLNLWELASGRSTPFPLSGHSEPVHSVEWTAEGAFAITCSSDRIRALDGACLLPGWTQQMEDGVNRDTGFIAVSSSGPFTFLLAMAAENGALLVLVGLLSADVLNRVQMEQPVRSLAWSPAKDLLAVGTGDGIVVYRANQEGFVGPARELTRHTPWAHALAFSGDGSLLASRDVQGFKIWDVEGARLIAALDENTETASIERPTPGIAFNPTRPLLATVTTNGTAVRILDLSELT